MRGSAEWGWTNYFYSAKDMNGIFKHSDRRAHDDTPLVAWVPGRSSGSTREKTRVRVIDVLDLHFYPQGDSIYGKTATKAYRGAPHSKHARAREALPTRTESWIKETPYDSFRA